MTIASEIIRNDHVGNGVLDTYPFEFIIYDQDNISVYVDGVIQTVDIHYTIAAEDIEDPTGGNIVFGVLYIPANLSKIAIISNAPYKQQTALASRDNTYEDTYDKGVILAKQLKEMIGRCIQLGISSTYSGLVLPEPMAGYYLRWAEDLSGLENISHPSDRFSLPDVYATIVTGVITVADGPAHYIVDTEGGAASDDLTKVLGLLPAEVFTISALHTDRTVVVKAGAFFKLAGGMDCFLSDALYEITFRMGTGNIAKELSRSSNA